MTLSGAGNFSNPHRGFVGAVVCRQGPEEGLLRLVPQNLEGIPCGLVSLQTGHSWAVNQETDLVRGEYTLPLPQGAGVIASGPELELGLQ